MVNDMSDVAVFAYLSIHQGEWRTSAINRGWGRDLNDERLTTVQQNAMSILSNTVVLCLPPTYYVRADYVYAW